MEKENGIMLLMTIVERTYGKPMSKLYAKYGVEWHYQSHGMGTASSELLDVLGFGSSERDILFSLGERNQVKKLMYDLNNELRGTVQTRGLAFSLKLSSLNRIVAEIITGNKEGVKEGESVMQEYGNYSLIVVVVNQGHTDEVMETAKKAGARGGTIMRARWNGSEESKQFFGIRLQEEKELIVLLTVSQTRNVIMESVQKEHGMNSPAGGVIFSLEVEQIVRMS